MAMVSEPGRQTPVVAETDVLVVGGGPAGQAAAVAAARAGAEVMLLERFGYLGGLASGGMVLLLDDMCGEREVSVGGLALEIIDRLERIGACVTPPKGDCFRNDAEVRDRWVRWGFEELYGKKRPKPIIYSGAFDPEGWKQVSQEMVLEAGAKLRFHSWFSRAIVEDGAVRGAVVETKSGRQAIRGRLVIDATGDGDVFASAGAPGVHGSYIMTLVHRLADVDTDAAIAFERADPAAAQQLDREVKQLLGGSWEMWWLLTPRPGVVWCNCPHIPGHDGLDPEHQTKIEIEARRRFMKVAEFVRAHYPGFQRAYILDAAPQLGVRQTRLLEGEYVVTKEDILERRTFPDVVARGRDYYTPYRSLVPKGIEGLLVAGRCYSATSEAQRISREIPPLMVMGEAAGTAAALSLESSVAPRKVDVSGLQKRLVAQGVNLGTR
ncbi:MAG: invasion protein [Candidatus Rokubacteria bacterium 13_2_20CM_2_64_8]|nr:MAG: invasion protein [Candidatus Rokubacteria bacterium 13_2_20CM_2_64_8]OLD93154.1 MAG: invasion protein [Candidatus Rokubacteria bacterium 13_1_20CM_4_68_9]